MEKNKNISVELIRVIAMFMIILDHILLPFDMPYKAMVAQLLNGGVFIFLLISGVLFGDKTIRDWKSWFKKRFVRIMIPFWIVCIIDALYETIILNNYNFKIFLIHIFNMQGIFGGTYNTATLWFVTLIMICYLITPLLQKIKEFKLSIKTYTVMAILTLGIQVLCAFATEKGMAYGHSMSWCVLALGMYSLGYFLGLERIDNIKGKSIIIFSGVTVVGVIGTFVARERAGDTVLYNRVISYDGLALLMLEISLILYKVSQRIHNEIICKIVMHFGSISYEFYLIHGFIIGGFMLGIEPIVGKGLYIVLTILCAYIGANIIKFLNKQTVQIVKKL